VAILTRPPEELITDVAGGRVSATPQTSRRPRTT
jgi:hypothetical protein